MASATALSAADSTAPLQPDPSFMSDVVRHLSHELRQPLSTIETSAFYLRLILTGHDCRVDQQLDRILLLVQNMSLILADAVHFLQAAPPRKQSVDLSELVSETIANHGIQQVEVDWAESTDVALVHADPAQAQHLVRVILSVFRQIAGPDQAVHLSLARSGDYAVLHCSTRADATLCEHCQDLLLPFTPHLPPGSGLALASVQRIAEAHSGRTVLKGENEVLTLEISLPASC